MKPKKFFEILSDKVNDLPPSTKKSIFSKSNLEVFKKISEYCDNNKKVIVLTDREQYKEFYKIIKEFNFSIYYTRRGWAIFLTNFDRKIYTKIRDDRYRFLKKVYPNCNELKRLTKERNKFFEHVLK